MKNILTCLAFFGVLAFTGVSGYGQEFRRWEAFGGYQYNSVSTGLGELNEQIGEDIFDNRVSAHGFNASLTGNITKRFGIKFDYSSNNATLFDDGTTRLRYRNQQFLGGVQIKNNEVDGPRWKPWAHILAGLANQKLRCSGDCEIDEEPLTAFTETNNSFSMVFGGGVDVKVHPRIDIRVIQVDYNPIFFGGNQTLDLSDRTQNNWRFSWGVVIH